MSPDLELVHTRQDESFRAWVHDYPHTVAKWHFHPEYEVHVITASSGKFFVGDCIDDFGPGNLVLTGPNLPHNWVSNLGAGSTWPGATWYCSSRAPSSSAWWAPFPNWRPCRNCSMARRAACSFPMHWGHRSSR
jgi:hypothetical protein